MVDIFDEVDEEVRRERMQAAAKRYGPFVGGGVAVLIAIVAGITIWRGHELSSREDAGAAFLAAARAQEAEPTAGQATFADLASEGPAGYPVVARFKQAEVLAAAGDRAGAVAALNGVDGLETPDRYKELARLLAIGLRSYDESADTLLPLVEPLAAAGRPWRTLAAEQAAMLEIKLGRLDAARTRLQALSTDLAAPNGVRERASAALTALPEG